MDDATLSLLKKGSLVQDTESGEYAVVQEAEDYFSDWIRLKWLHSGVVEDLPFCACERLEAVRQNGNGHHEYLRSLKRKRTE